MPSIKVCFLTSKLYSQTRHSIIHISNFGDHEKVIEMFIATVSLLCLLCCVLIGRQPRSSDSGSSGGSRPQTREGDRRTDAAPSPTLALLINNAAGGPETLSPAIAALISCPGGPEQAIEPLSGALSDADTTGSDSDSRRGWDNCRDRTV